MQKTGRGRDQNVFDSGPDGINCFGYKSCELAQSIREMSYGHIGCYGSYSCYSAITIKRTTSLYTNRIYCEGLFSCANVTQLYNSRGWIGCNGEKSCYNSNITTNLGSVECQGERSCANSYITTSGFVFLEGYLSGMNSVLISGSTLVDFYFRGSQSGYNATVICATGHQCNIFCDGNGCNGLNVICNDGCVLSIDCDDAQLSDICSDGVSCYLYGTIFCFLFYVFCLYLCNTSAKVD